MIIFKFGKLTSITSIFLSNKMAQEWYLYSKYCSRGNVDEIIHLTSPQF